MIKVGINGYGTIGKRVAEAVTLQDDMEIIYETVEELEEYIKELQKDIKDLERRKRDK